MQQPKWYQDYRSHWYWLIIGLWFSTLGLICGTGSIMFVWFCGIGMTANFVSIALATRHRWLHSHHRDSDVTGIIQSPESSFMDAIDDNIAIRSTLYPVIDPGSPTWMRCNVCTIHLPAHGKQDHPWVEWARGPDGEFGMTLKEVQASRQKILESDWWNGVKKSPVSLDDSGRLVPVPSSWEITTFEVEGQVINAVAMPPWSTSSTMVNLVKHVPKNGSPTWRVDISELSDDERADVLARESEVRQAKYEARRLNFPTI